MKFSNNEKKKSCKDAGGEMCKCVIVRSYSDEQGKNTRPMQVLILRPLMQILVAACSTSKLMGHYRTQDVKK